MPASPRVLVLIGSLRKESINRKLANAIKSAAGDRAGFDMPDIGALGFFNQDEEAEWPAHWTAFKDAIEAADAVLVVTPEYNRSMPGVLKNALDIASRPWGKNSFAGKPAALIGASIAKTGAAMSQQHARNVLSYLDTRLMPQPEGYVQAGTDGSWDEGTDKFIAKFTDAMLGWFAGHAKS